ncbi:MAG TPA: TonB-dependent receptor plug domain-containing protein [Chitinophagales bacterium]|nr:TonB-dependent receptor plug domain-containing protein [Chitinophagales bacterium]
MLYRLHCPYINHFYFAVCLQWLCFTGLAGLGFTGSAVMAQTLSGAVLHAQTREPLAGAMVVALPSGTATTTNHAGLFTLAVLPSDDHISVSFLGFIAQKIAVVPTNLPLTCLLAPNEQELATVNITAYHTGQKLLQTPAAVVRLPAALLQLTDNTNYLPALNTVAGVKMEQRSMGSYRISIRGSLLRSPFGMRNIKMYLNDIPITDAGGENPINNIDPLLPDAVEVVKGPASSLYGAGTGGALLFTANPPPATGMQIKTGAMAGSYGLQQYSAQLQTATQQADATAIYTRRRWNGYRQHENHRFDGVNLLTRFYPDAKNTITLMALYADVRFQIAGNIDSAAVAANPRQFGGQAQTLNANVNKQRLIAGVSHRYRVNKNLTNLASASGFWEVKDNPYGTNAFNSGIKRESGSGFNLRTQTTYQNQLGSAITARLTAGAEWLHSFLATKDYVNLQGAPGAIRQDNELFLSQLSVFAQAAVELPWQLQVVMGGSYNFNRYQIDQLLPTARPDTALFTFAQNLQPVFSPRLGVVKTIWKTVALQGSISRGFAPPAAEELVLPNGSLNLNLQAETGANYELGIRGSFWRGKLFAEVNAYRLLLKNEILAQGQPAIYYNSGKTQHQGVEAMLQATLANDEQKMLSECMVLLSYARQPFVFTRYTNLQPDAFANNQLPGVAPHTVSAAAKLAFKWGFYLNLNHNFYAQTPLNNANTDFAPAYHLLNARLGYRKTLFTRWQIELFAGANNLLNEQYSAFHNLNAPGKRYFNPSPARNYYGGVQVQWHR